LLTGRTGEIVEALSNRKADVACIQDTRWKDSGFKFYGAKGQRYKLIWMGGEERSNNVGILIAEKWVDSVVNVERHSKRVLILKMILRQWFNIKRFYGLCSSLRETRGGNMESLWNEVFHFGQLYTSE